jgi:hypothetical protein
MKTEIDNNEKLSAENETPPIANVLLPAVFFSGGDKQEQIKKELKELLVKFKAELTIENFGRNLADNEKIVVDFDWDDDLCNRTDNGSVPQWVVGRWENGW